MCAFITGNARLFPSADAPSGQDIRFDEKQIEVGAEILSAIAATSGFSRARVFA
jgi:hypothetical protein